MMRKILNIFLIAAACMLLSCNKENIVYPAGGNTGTIDLSSIALTCNTEETVLRSGENTDIQNYIVSIYNQQNVLQNEWKYNEMPEVLTLSAGEYVLKVKSHEPVDAAWEAPYYYAEKNFTIIADQMTVIGDIVCVLSNVKVTVEYSEDLLAVLGEGCKVNVGLGLGTLDFAIDETRAGYFTVKEESNRIYAYFTGPIDGYVDTIYREIDNVKAGEWRILRYSLKSPEPGEPANGSFTPSLQVDVTCFIVEQNIEIPVEEDVIDDPEPSDPDTPTPPPSDEEGPVITATTFDISEPQIVTDELIIKIMVTSENPLSGFTVDIESTTLTADELESVGLSTHLDLANPGELKENLQGLGFPVEDQVVGQNELSFDITQFSTLLSALGAGTHKFIMTATDNKDNVTTETLTLITQ